MRAERGNLGPRFEALSGGDHDWVGTIDAEAVRLTRDGGCVERAQAAIDATAFDLESVRRQVETMTFDDLIAYALREDRLAARPLRSYRRRANDHV